MKLTQMLIALAGVALLASCETVTPPGPEQNVSISLSRSVCFGACPDYDVAITGDGQVTYNGRRFVRVTGEQHGQASPADVAHLLEMFDRAHFFELRDAYRAQVTDLPSQRITLTRGGRTKMVEDYGGRMIGMPQAVSELEAEIDRVARTDQWVRRESGCGTPKP